MLETIKNGQERERRVHFDEIVENYDRVRWNYPDELYKDIFDYTKTNISKNAIEIGAGTGKATLPFLENGYNVTAIELGINMAEFLKNKFIDNNKFNVIISAFEDTSLEKENYDLVFAASSFHWVDPEIGCPKVFSILRNGGVFALFRSNNLSDRDHDLYSEFQEVYKKYYHKPYVEPIKLTEEDFWEPKRINGGFGFNDLCDYGFINISKKHYYSEIIYNSDDYIGLLDTMSDHRSLPENDRKGLYTGIKEIILKHGGLYKVKYFYQLYMGRKPNK